MLAYLFWHQPRDGVDAARYEAAVREFHGRLAEEALGGVHGSATYAVGDLPWLGGGPGYEDWYFLEASFALDTLNTAAVSGQMTGAHQAVAAMTGHMTAGLYHLEADTWRRQMVLGPVPELPRLPAEGSATRRQVF